jgi:hypothetical protein
MIFYYNSIDKSFIEKGTEKMTEQSLFVPEIFEPNNVYQNRTIIEREQIISDALRYVAGNGNSTVNCIMQILESKTDYFLQIDCDRPENQLKDKHREEMVYLGMDTLYELKTVNASKGVRFQVTYPIE